MQLLKYKIKFMHHYEELYIYFVSIGWHSVYTVHVYSPIRRLGQLFNYLQVNHGVGPTQQVYLLHVVCGVVCGEYTYHMWWMSL